MTEGLQQQRGLADSGISSQQYHSPLDQPAPEHAIKLGDACRIPRLFSRIYVAQVLHLAGFRHCCEAGCSSLGNCLDQRIPCLAMWALTLPFERLTTAFNAGVCGFAFSHRKRVVAGLGARADEQAPVQRTIVPCSETALAPPSPVNR
jgi:hypothetical protein